MASNEVYIGQRRSYEGALCTIRYRGLLPSLKGEWLGVEWDDPVRGKHNGSHEGQQIFTCLSSSPTAASFLRPFRKHDRERTLLEAIRFKYSPSTSDTAKIETEESTIEISGKVVEEVGFDRIQKQLSILADLKIVLVDELVLSGIAPHGASKEDIRNAQAELGQTCPNIVELDLGWNTVETWQDVAEMCVPFKKMKILKASGLRLRSFTAKMPQDVDNPFRTVEELHLNECLLTPEQVVQIVSTRPQCGFPSLKTLSLTLNGFDFFPRSMIKQDHKCPTITSLVLDNNKLKDLSFLPTLTSLYPNTMSLSLQSNAISQLALETVRSSDAPPKFEKLETLNLAGNQIRSYAFVDALPALFPNLTSLRISRNPLYDPIHDHDDSDSQAMDARRQRQSSVTSDSTSYYLTLARIPHLRSLNYTTITPRDREEGEIYYLSLVGKEIKALLEMKEPGAASTNHSPSNQAAVSPDAKATLARQQHPLYTTLCTKYERDDIIQHFLVASREPPPESHPDAAKPHSELDTYAPGTLGARLVDAYFYIPASQSQSSQPISSSNPAEASLHRLLPTTISVYRLKSLVARHFALPALQFRLVYESHEYDPVEPLSRTSRNKGGENNWEGWGDWDVDHDEGDDDENHDDAVVDSSWRGEEAGELHGGGDESPMYIARDGQRFKKRETEILDGMRSWGDFLDLTAPDGSRRVVLKVRVELLGR